MKTYEVTMEGIKIAEVRAENEREAFQTLIHYESFANTAQGPVSLSTGHGFVDKDTIDWDSFDILVVPLRNKKNDQFAGLEAKVIE